MQIMSPSSPSITADLYFASGTSSVVLLSNVQSGSNITVFIKNGSVTATSS